MIQYGGKRLRDRKGVAIELAILVMVVMFSFSLLITTTSLLHHDKRSKAEKEMAQMVAIEQMAQNFCAAAESADHSWAAAYPDYAIQIDGMNLTVKEKDSETVLLHLTLENDAGTKRISAWETNERRVAYGQ